MLLAPLSPDTRKGGNIDETLAMLRVLDDQLLQQDGLGSVTSLSNGAGALAQTYTFDSFGNQTASRARSRILPVHGARIRL